MVLLFIFRVSNLRKLFYHLSEQSIFLTILFSFALCPIVMVSANAEQVSLKWKANSEADIAGYRVHYGVSSRNYQYSTDVKKSLSCTISGLNSGTTYYFAVTAYDTQQYESSYSKELVHTISSGGNNSTTSNFNSTSSNSTTGQIVDNGDAGSSSIGTWSVSGAKKPYGGSSLYSGKQGAEYIFEATLRGQSEVQLWWTATANRCSQAPVEIYDGNKLLDVVEINQKIDGGRWNTLGTYAFSGRAQVVILSEGGCTACADALRLLP